MLHTKLLLRRLAYVPWLLVACLALSWGAEEAAAQTPTLTLTVDKSTVREDAGKTEIKATVKASAKVTQETNVVILVSDTDGAATPGNANKGLNNRYRIQLPTITIAKDKDSGEGMVILTPISADRIGYDGQTYSKAAPGEVDVKIALTPSAGEGFTGVAGTITLQESNKPTSNVVLSLDPKKLSQEAIATTVEVTATLDGKKLNAPLRFDLVLANLDDDALGDNEEHATRDLDYTATLGSITIPTNKISATGKITIDPKRAGSDAEKDAVFNVTGNPASFEDDKVPSSNVDPTSTSTKIAIDVGAAKFTIERAPIAAAKGLTATPASIREEAGETEITLNVELEKALNDDAEVKFTIGGSEDDVGTRDVDYTVSIEDLTISKGETKGSTTLTLTPVNNTDTSDDGVTASFTVTAQVGTAAQQNATITITDDEKLSSAITLAVNPKEIQENAGPTDVTVTATLDGKALDKDEKLVLVLGNTVSTDDDGDGATAIRDVDYTATLRSLTIKAGEISGETTIEIIPVHDGAVDKDETIIIKSSTTPKNVAGDNVAPTKATITLKDSGVPTATTPEEDGDTTPAFSDDDVAAASTLIEGTVGEALEHPLPAAETGDGILTYSVSASLPAGLSFNPATRTISGTPTAASKGSIVYTVVDGDTGDQLPKESAVLTYKWEISAMPEPKIGVESVTATRRAVRENAETTSITLTAKLASPALIAGEVHFALVASGDAAAVRDVDYTASVVGGVAIAAGATEASTTLTLTPINNEDADGNKVLTVRAESSGGSAETKITIADDETASTSISLSMEPDKVSESAAGEVIRVIITATLDGKVLDTNATVAVKVDPASVATRDEDYTALFNPRLEIPAGAVSGSIPFLITPAKDDEAEGNEAITLRGEIEGLIDGEGVLLISDADAGDTSDPEPDPPALAFEEGAAIGDINMTAELDLLLVLPEASGGSGDIAYSTSDLPVGLSFDPATRTLSGTPEAATDGAVEVTYTATDSAGASVSLSFSITINAPLEFDDLDLSGLFGALLGAGKANPASEHAEGAVPFTVGEPVNRTLPAVSGGTPPLTYSVSGLPAGLSFDPATRTISGTPTQASDVVVVTYTVTDGSGASRSLPFSVVVVEPRLDPPDKLEASDYRGADGAGDQGGFVLLTWGLSDDHATLDGYRIFRELPVLNNEMVPWAAVDAVPGVQSGVAIVATLDNVATNWGIAAERDGKTTHEAAKAVFVSAKNLDQPYERMAETLMASKEAAQVGDAPVFASLLPEALAFAEGVVPKLNLVEGVLESSAITMTEAPVRAIDNIAPLAVPSISVLDAPNDAGSRILLTWTLSPSDQLLQGVVADAIGPTAVEPVVGVHGYGIYRRVAGEDEFAMIAQVDAGVTSFVDATALNGVRYTYQVRPYDLDNETVSDVEQTAMAIRNSVLDSDGRAIFGLFGADNRIGFDDFFLFADHFGLTAEDAGFDPAFDIAPSATIDFDDFFVFADHFGRSTAGAGKRVPMLAGLNADARMYLDARTAMPNVGEDFVLDVRIADFVAVKGYGLQVQYDASKLEFVQTLTEQPLGGSELAAPQVLSDEAGVLALGAHGDIVSEGEMELSLVFRAKTEIENTVIEITDTQTYDSEFGFNSLALPAPVQLQTRPEVFGLADNYPNPFNPATTIRYSLPQAMDVELTVYNVVGQAVRTLVAEHQSAGRYVVEWDATNDSGHSLSSGMYFYHLQAAGGEFREVKKMLLLK